MAGIRDIVTGLLVGAAATGGQAQNEPPVLAPAVASASVSDPAQALFTLLKANAKLEPKDMQAAIGSLKNGVTLSPDKDFAIVIDREKQTFAALKLATDENGLSVQGPLASFKAGAPEKMHDSAITYSAAEAVTRLLNAKQKNSDSTIAKILAEGPADRLATTDKSSVPQR